VGQSVLVRWWPICILMAGCTFDPRRHVIEDAPDIGVADGPVDALTVDVNPVDLCLAKYGTLGQYELCSSTPTSCTFYVDIGSGKAKCPALCEPLGGTCLQSRDGSCSDTNHGPEDCDGDHTDQVCTCSL